MYTNVCGTGVHTKNWHFGDNFVQWMISPPFSDFIGTDKLCRWNKQKQSFISICILYRPAQSLHDQTCAEKCWLNPQKYCPFYSSTLRFKIILIIIVSCEINHKGANGDVHVILVSEIWSSPQWCQKCPCTVEWILLQPPSKNYWRVCSSKQSLVEWLRHWICLYTIAITLPTKDTHFSTHSPVTHMLMPQPSGKLKPKPTSSPMPAPTCKQ